MQRSDYTLPLVIPGLKFFQWEEPFSLESGESLPHLTIAYHTYGTLNAQGSNVIWVCHALTANSDVADWWEGVFGAEKLLDPERYFIVCANILGSCYGSTGPRSISPDTDSPYGTDFPLFTIKDMVNAHEILRRHLEINEIALCIGGSCGGHQVLEFAYLLPDKIKKIALLVTSARETAWAIAIHEAQRLAIEADSSWAENNDSGGQAGLKAARGMGLIGYRTFEAYKHAQTDSGDLLDNFRAASYIKYQGDKLVRRFYAQCYWYLTKALDAHHIGRGRGGTEAALNRINMPALVVSIDSDVLIPPSEQQFLAAHLPDAEYHEIHSAFGHDGFLIEATAVNSIVGAWFRG